MATDPVQSIQQQRFEAAFVRDLRQALDRLAELPPSPEVPYLTASIDWRPEGSQPNRRAARRRFDQEAQAVLEGRQAHEPATESLRADVERIGAYLDGELPPSVQGAVIVACHASDVFRAIPLGLPAPTKLTVAPTPALFELARVAEDNPPFAVVLLDQQEATLLMVAQGRPDRSVEVESTGFPRHQMQGGWSQMRYQRRADERTNAFVDTVAEETRKALDEAGIRRLVLAGDEQITTTLLAELHQTIQERVVGSIRHSVNTGEQEVIDAALPLVEAAERAREMAAVQAVRDGVGAGGEGAGGAEDTLTALQTGQVMTLVINDDFDAPGWADYSLPVYGAGEVPTEHPAGGDVAAIVPVSLPDEMVRLALQAGAEIEVVRTAVPVSATKQADVPEGLGAQARSPAALALDQFGGVGAVLRFALADRQPTADL